MKQSLDATRRTASRVLLWSFVASLLGAFSASYAAMRGGRSRDEMPA